MSQRLRSLWIKAAPRHPGKSKLRDDFGRRGGELFKKAAYSRQLSYIRKRFKPGVFLNFR
jgi:hypothetical protein